MVVDIPDNAHRYSALHKDFVKAFDFLARPDLKKMETNTYEIDGDRIYAIVALDPGRKKEEALLEIHKKYIDIQLILDGTDNMGWKSKAACNKPAGEYDAERDLQFFADEPDVWLAMKSGSFAIFFPEDAHMPLISTGQIHKVIVKIAVNPV